jgi:hypothetical protein
MMGIPSTPTPAITPVIIISVVMGLPIMVRPVMTEIR